MGFLSFIFGGKKRQIFNYLKQDAAILDVRSLDEWEAGHIEQAIHVPLQDLNQRVDELKRLQKPIIVCCESGIRSAKAAKFLNLQNIDAINGGGWVSVKKLLEL